MAHPGLTAPDEGRLRRALVIGPAWVGDMVMAHTLVQLLAARFDVLHMAAPAATAALAHRMPEIAQVHTLPFAHGEWALGARMAHGRALARQNFDAAFVLPNSWKSALVPFFARIPRRTGWRGEVRFLLLNDLRVLDAAGYPLMIERFMALADDEGKLPAPYPLPRLVADADNGRRLIDSLTLDAAAPVVLCPGAEFGPAKQWPARHYAHVTRAAQQQGAQVWLLGSPRDHEACEAIAALAPGCVNLAGRTSLLDAVDLLSLAHRVVSNDSGLMHVACALGRHTVGVFGSTSAAFTPPLGDNAHVVERELSCRPCFERTCPLGHTDCLQGLPPDDVLKVLL